MKLKSRKAAMYWGLVLIMAMMPILPVIVDANTTNESKGIQVEENERTASYVETITNIVSSREDIKNAEQCLFYKKAVACAAPYMEVKESEDEASATAGKLFEYNIADVLEQNGMWTKIKSGNLIGFVRTEQLCLNEEAEQVAKLTTNVTAAAAFDNVSIYASNLETAGIIGTLAQGEQVTPVKFMDEYLVIRLADGQDAYVIKQNVNIDYGFGIGLTVAEEEAIIAEEAAARAAEEAARRAEEERIAAEAARRQEIINRTKDGTEFTNNPTITISDEDLWLMACVIDWEAGWESYEGKLAVANIILNRYRSTRYPNTIPGIIYARYQFSGVSTLDGRPTERFAQRLAAGPRLEECITAALQALAGDNNVRNFTAFISTSIANYASYPDYMIIGGHCFY